MSPTFSPEGVVLAALAGFALWYFLGRNKHRPTSLSSDQIQDLRRKGAQILDVRSQGEFATGNIKGSRNIPLGELPGRMGELKKDKPILACCASGMRSARAESLLLKAGFTQVHNVGPWHTLKP